jgi:UDP-N-acetylmuramoylalanine--D-glutamate ligase
MSSDLRGKRVVIFGVGHFGGQIEAARFMCRAGARVLATDLKPREKLEEALHALAGEPIEWRLGEHREEDLRGADLVVVSPAVPKSSPFLALLRRERIATTTEMNLTAARLRAPIFAVTGSNGKSTTTALLGKIVEAAGLRAFVGGNIGRPLLNELDRIGPEDRAVLELSSFQLEDLREAGGVRPRLAIVTNITPNHLDRHGTIEEYAAAKRTIVEGQEPEDVAALNRDDPRVLAFAAHTRARVVTFGLEAAFPGEGSFVAGGRIAFRDAAGRAVDVLDAAALRLRGRHNLMNALAVAAAALAAGLPREAVARGLAEFEGIPDRLEVVLERRGVRYVNDTKATTPEAAIAALEAFSPPIVLIAGGQDKGMDARGLVRAIVARAEAALVIGKVREPLAAAIAEARGPAASPAVKACASLEEAFAEAVRAARPGATVLLSPAYASYDMFASYEERGERFRALARGLGEG